MAYLGKGGPSWLEGGKKLIAPAGRPGEAEQIHRPEAPTEKAAVVPRQPEPAPPKPTGE